MAHGILVGLSVWYVLGTALVIASVGKHRKPLTPGVAAGTAVISAIIITALAYVSTQLR